MSSRQTNSTVPLDYSAKRQQRAPRQSRLGDYHVLAPIARGGTAGVYLAEHARTKEQVALKVLDPCHADNSDLVARLLREREVSARVTHPGLLHIASAERNTAGTPFLVMEYVDGENLGALAERGRMELDAAIAIAACIAGALAALHDVGLVHCDVKCDNVLVAYGDELQIKVIDYGVVRRVDDPPTLGSIAGTPAYLAPEQWRGRPCPKSDVYGLGCLLYELVTGELPFQGTLPELMQAHAELLPPRPSVFRTGVESGIEDLIMRMLAKDPELRPSMREIEQQLALPIETEAEVRAAS